MICVEGEVLCECECWYLDQLPELGDACCVSLAEPGYQAAERCCMALSTWLS